MSRYFAPVRVVLTQQQARIVIDVIGGRLLDVRRTKDKRARRVLLAAHARLIMANAKAHAKDREAGRA